MANVGYARVSTLDQELSLQLDALVAAGCGKVFEDHASSARADREGLRAALDYVRDGEVLVVWKLDRLGRSLPHLIETVTDLAKRGVGFRSLTEAIDTTTPGGRLIFHIFGALGQFERDLIGERTRAGVVAAAARGRKSGRKPVITDDKLKRARDGRQGPHRARDRDTAEGGQNRSLPSAQGQARLTASPPLAIRPPEVAARDTSVGSGPPYPATTGMLLSAP